MYKAVVFFFFYKNQLKFVKNVTPAKFCALKDHEDNPILPRI